MFQNQGQNKDSEKHGDDNQGWVTFLDYLYLFLSSQSIIEHDRKNVNESCCKLIEHQSYSIETCTSMAIILDVFQ